MSTLEDKLRSSVMAAAILEEQKSKHSSALRWLVPAIAAACLITLICIPQAPKDTFDNPELAYVEIENTFKYISRKIDMGTDIASKAKEPIETITNIIK